MALPDLDLLVAIVDSGSLSGAAEKLGMPRATVSRRLTRLEEEFGAVLVHRTTRSLSISEAGQELYRHARPIVDAVDTARSAVRSRDGEPRGLLRVTLPPGRDIAFSDMLSSYMHDYPKVRLEVVAVSRHVDLIAEGFDVGVRAGQLTGSSLMSKKLLGIETILVASPDYLARRGVPQSPDDLAHHDALVGFARGEVPTRTWPLTSGDTVSISPRLATNDLLMTGLAALSGHGLALIPRGFAARALEDGRLVQVLADSVGSQTGIWVVYPEKRLMLPRVRLFIDRLEAWARALPLEGMAGL